MEHTGGTPTEVPCSESQTQINHQRPSSVTLTLSADGLTGPFVIHSPSDPLRRGIHYDIDQVMFVRDNFHSMSTDIVDGMLSTAGFAGTMVAPSPKSGLMCVPRTPARCD